MPHGLSLHPTRVLWGEGQDSNSGCGTNEEAGKHVEGIMNTEVDAGKGDEYT